MWQDNESQHRHHSTVLLPYRCFQGDWHDHGVDTSAHQLLSSQKCVIMPLMKVISLLSPTTYWELMLCKIPCCVIFSSPKLCMVSIVNTVLKVGTGTLEKINDLSPRSKDRKGQSQTVWTQSHATGQFTNVSLCSIVISCMFITAYKKCPY